MACLKHGLVVPFCLAVRSSVAQDTKSKSACCICGPIQI